MAQIKPPFETFARIKVIGCGGSGGNALARMIEARIHGVEFIAINTDAQALHATNAPAKIHIGKSLTKGLGAGMNPDTGRQAAEDTKEEIQNALKGSDMVFLATGLGGGTAASSLFVSAAIANVELRNADRKKAMRNVLNFIGFPSRFSMNRRFFPKYIVF